jgi:hypothetical protein
MLALEYVEWQSDRNSQGCIGWSDTGVAFCSILDRQNTLFDVGRWTFDVGRSSVSVLIKLAASWPAAGARMKLQL